MFSTFIFTRRRLICRHPQSALVTSLVSAILLLTNSVGHAETFNCPAGDVDCLVSAITAANDLGGANEIYLEEGVYTLTVAQESQAWGGASGLPYIRNDLLIRGENSIIERDPAAPHFRILTAEYPGSLTVEGLVIRGGHATADDDYWGGGGIASIYSSGLVIRDSLIVANSSEGGPGGVHSEGNPVVVENSTIRENIGLWTGGLYDFCFPPEETRIINSTIDMNASAYSAGGVDSECIAVVIDSTISRNASGDTGGLIAWGMRAVNATLTENVGSGINGVGGFRVQYAFYDPYWPEMKLKNTIVAANSGTLADDCAGGSILPADAGDNVSLGHNIIGNPAGCDLVLQATDQVGDPGLSEYVDDGQPGHGHFPLVMTSPAVDVGDDGACSLLDQIGNPRFDGDRDGMIVCDVGAIEYQGELYELEVDVKPGNAGNPINPRKRGRFWLAVLSDSDVDATQVDPMSIELGAGAAAPDRYRVGDVNRDRTPDLLLRFVAPQVGVVCGDTELELSGKTYFGDRIHGVDTIRTVGCTGQGTKRRRK